MPSHTTKYELSPVCCHKEREKRNEYKRRIFMNYDLECIKIIDKIIAKKFHVKDQCVQAGDYLHVNQLYEQINLLKELRDEITSLIENTDKNIKKIIQEVKDKK